jgi:hypothetical protein
VNITYTENSKRWREGYELLKQATKRLEEILGPSADSVAAEWEGDVENGRPPMYRLKLRDATGEVGADFTVDGLRVSAYVNIRLSRLWGDLLRIRSDLQHSKVLQMVQELEGG